MKKQLLFVTYQTDESDEGINYAIDLARTLNEGLTVLLVKAKGFRRRFEDIMSAVAFAEANEPETARAVLSGKYEAAREGAARLIEKCQQSEIEVSLHETQLSPALAVDDFLRKKNSVDMVVLSPGVTENGDFSSRELRRLLGTTTRPIVALRRPELQSA